MMILQILLLLCAGTLLTRADSCPPSQAILPCRCSLRGKEIQIWCSHSNLPQIMDGLKAVERNIKSQIDELVLENNQLPALPGRFFGNLQIVRLMLRYNSIERVSNGWLNELENSLVEIFIVEPQLRSIPAESLNGMINMLAITIQSDELKHLPDFSGLLSLTYLSVQTGSLLELAPHIFRHLPKLQHIHITGGSGLTRLEAGLFDGLISLKNLDLSHNGLNWIHLRALTRLPNLVSLKLSHNQISDVGMIGRIVKDLEHLKKLRLDHNIINVIEDGSFVDLPNLSELHLNDNRITELQYGAFLRTPQLKTIYLQNNLIRRIHPESLLQASGSGVEAVHIYNNEIGHVEALRALLDALPTLRYLDMSGNLLSDLPYGALRGHGTLEQLHLNNNQLRLIERDALMAMPALRELRMRNNSLSSDLPLPFWNLPGLKGLDLAQNQFVRVDSQLLAGLPSLRRLDLSENGLREVAPNSFRHNPLLETLNISSNGLSKIHSSTLLHLERLFEVDASFNQLTAVIAGLPRIVERISLKGNEIGSLPAAASKSLQLPNLRMLDLSQNRIEQLPRHGFEGAAQLRVLSLAQNQLRQLEDTSFIGIQRLELLHLQENQLGEADERALLPLAELRNLNLQSNKLEAITDNFFSNNSRLEQLDLSRNLIRSISPTAFDTQRSLEYLDLSGNGLLDISVGLGNLHSLRDIDLSYNQISRVQSDVIGGWRNVVEIRLSNNLIVELQQGTFRNLPKLQYLDLSSNEIRNVEPGALKGLDELQEFVLADNKLVELKDHVFEELPSLLASHFQYNKLRYISPESFHNANSLVFLNLSNNHFRNMENIGLRSMRNLEVLDLSTNGVKLVSTMPLKALNWLVELKMDNNQICRIQGAPFETMPRLRVLSMRNNQLRSIKERTFRNLRGNIAILDVDGNPIDCNCEMQWLSVWLQETNFPYPGPKCQDGRLLRAARMERSLCAGVDVFNNNERTEANHLPLLNEHGDVFQRDLPDDFTDECEVFEATRQPGDRPMVGESEYFYDQYVDSTDPPDAANTVLSTSQRPKPVPTLNSNIDLNNTLLHTKYFNRRPQPGAGAAGGGSPFTFFGYPIPSVSLGRFFGFGDRGRKQRTDGNDEMPATHRMASINLPSGRGKTRMYQPNSAEFEKYLKEQQQQQNVARNRYMEVDTTTNSAEETLSNESGGSATTVGVFRTTFREPSSIERGGFRPIVPAHVGGFMPVHDPQQRRGLVEAVNVTGKNPEPAQAKAERNFMPISVYPRPRPTPNSVESVESATYDVTEMTPDVTTIVPLVQSTRGATTRPTTTTRATTTTVRTTTTTTTTPEPTIVNDSSSSSEQEQLDSHYDDDDLEAQSVTLLRPPPLVQTTTAETILLIPPAEEHVAQIKSHSWVTTTTPQSPSDYQATPVRSTSTVPPPAPPPPLRSGGRSTITKVFTPHQPQGAQPTAEEYQRTTPSADNEGLASEHQLTAQKRTELELLQVDRLDRKDGMDWYYESFKKKRDFNGGAAVRKAAHKEVFYGGIPSDGESTGSWNRFNKKEIIFLSFLLLWRL
ncbi:GL12775 [Drosophila persimilis]|uniref:GL12775 n=1 Tax=Drosophila persimilis TaxID=7234 RepID=B4H7M6_DROPE|nr:protein artichoke [Drosophila persimilis]XP_026848511.1 protein artichoke [Drosophila persimilis]EDW34666.1 GL12775 [Drosophila persimilis]